MCREIVDHAGHSQPQEILKVNGQSERESLYLSLSRVSVHMKFTERLETD